jgi:putative endopeptidase
MKSETKKHRHKKSHIITRKVREIVLQKAIPPYPQVPPLQSSKKPGHDFYLYVNGIWIHQAKTPSYRSAYGVSEELEEIIKEKILILLEKSTDYAKRGNTSRAGLEKAFQLVGRFGMSALRPSVQPKSIHLLKKMLSDISCIRNTDDISRALGYFIKIRITSLFTFYTFFEAGKKIHSRFAISPGQLGLPDPSYYFQNESGRNSTLSLYGEMLDKIASLLDLDEKLSPVIHIESIFAKNLLKYRYQNETYIYGKELSSKYPALNWKLFWDELGYSDWKSNLLKLNPPGWLKVIDHMVKALSLENWKLLLKTHLILHALPLLPPPFDDIHSEFYEKHLRGQVKKLPQKELTVRLLQEWMPNTISRLYLKYHFDEDLKKEVTKFVETIQKAAMNRIQATEWFSEKTKRKAVEKVNRMKMGIAFPNKMPPLEIVSLQTDNLLQNIILLGEHHTITEVKEANKVIDVENEWNEAIFAVNAYYFSEVNQLILPAGSLLWPFYNKHAPTGWNYGGLGAIIGHEMTHAFDSDGKDYNWEGQKEKWWTPHDNREYNKRAKALIYLYNQAKVLDHPVNGALTLNENISDLGGLAIALDALNMELDNKKLSPEQRSEAYRNFFISYAVSWRIKEKPEKVIQGLFMDRHAPAPLRVNLIVSQFDEWYEAFNIQVKDALYIPPEERIRIF